MVLDNLRMPVHAYGALKGKPRVLRTVNLLFRLPRDSTLRSIRERVEFLKLACLQPGKCTVYYKAAWEAYNTWRRSWLLRHLPGPSAFVLRVGR